jgi:hypothetical protein
VRPGELLRLAAAGIRQVFTATVIFRITDRLVQEIWRNADDLVTNGTAIEIEVDAQ